ncbi:GNAT family N-acetyltransferase [Proteus hauseri]|uniref:GNAT family N-acetyltransferase n=1 Tax=Proteus hauseri TaxID=183417 RepID=UPI0010095E46|nr:GNAT family N-acetyltransferase [Proteus hauseri]QAV21884.1 GNAT family N-acetyltransferase [Proteus hauseri]
MKIRLATLSELHLISQIDTYAQIHSSRIDEIKTWINENSLYLVVVDTVVVAYGVFHYRFFQCGFIELIMVDENYRSQGLATKLITYFKASSKTAKIFTSTNQSNLKMKAILSRSGFVESGCVDNLDEDDTELIYYLNTLNM